MHKQIFRLLIIGTICLSFSNPDRFFKEKQHKYVITKIEMSLSAMGVESNRFPYIVAKINCLTKKSICKKSFDNPKYKSSTYFLTKKEIDKIIWLIENSDLEKIPRDYKEGPTDQPTSTTIIYTNTNKFVFTDYSLQAGSPLKEIYKIVYKLNFR